MKKLINLTAAATIAVLMSGCVTSEPSLAPAAKLDVDKVCSISASGINSVVETAVQYNAIAKANGVEFMRLGMKNTQYIEAVQEAIKTKAPTINIVDKKKKVTGTMSTEDAAQRACRFSVVALQQAVEAKSTWRLAIPGDGFKY